MINSRLRDLGVSGSKVGSHRLRKTAATLAWQAGVDPTVIQEMLGHEHLSTTLDGYIRPAMQLNSSAADSTHLKPMEPGDD
jgi:integrase